MQLLIILFSLFFAGESTVWTVSWSHDDAYIAVGNDHGELSIFETTHWKKVKSWKYDGSTITRVEWNPAFPILAVASVTHGSARPLMLYDISADKVIKALPDTLQGRALTWSASGEEIAFVGDKGRISVFSKNGEHRKTLSFTNSGGLFEIDWHPTKNILLAVEEDIYLIDIDGDSVIAKYDDGQVGKGILCCQWHPSGEFFVTGDYGHVSEEVPNYLCYWDVQGRLLHRLAVGQAEYRNARWSKDGRFLAAASDGLIVFNEKGVVVSKVVFSKASVWGVAWDGGGGKVVSSDGAGGVRVTDVRGKVVKSFRL